MLLIKVFFCIDFEISILFNRYSGDLVFFFFSGIKKSNGHNRLHDNTSPHDCAAATPASLCI